MQFKIPKNTDKYQWTEHSIYKMKQYGLTAQRVLRVINAPQRREVGIVKNTIAVMQPASTRFVSSPASPNRGKSKRGGPTFLNTKNGKKVWSSEIWAMYQSRLGGTISKSQFPISNKITNPKFKILNSANRKIRIISAWRYPGVSPKRDPIPEEILNELSNLK